MEKEKLSEIAFGIIANAGNAKSLYLEAIDLAEKFEIEKAKEKIKEAQKYMADSHKYHYEVIVEESQGKDANLSLLLIHAEDQFMSAETTGCLADKFINLYQKLKKEQK